MTAPATWAIEPLRLLAAGKLALAAHAIREAQGNAMGRTLADMAAALAMLTNGYPDYAEAIMQGAKEAAE